MGRPDAFGRKTVYIRISDRSRREYVSTPFKLAPANFKKGQAIGIPQAKQINEELKRLIIKTEYKALDSTSLKAKKDPTFKEYALGFIENQSRTHKPATTTQNWSEFKKFNGFEPDIRISAIDHKVLVRYQQYLIQLGNAPNSVWKSFKFLHKIINTAYLTRVIDTNPFVGFKNPKYVNPKRSYLTDREIGEIQKIADNPAASKEVRFIATWFLIGCYTALRYSDWQQFDVSTHIIDNRLMLHTTKTGEMVSMPLMPQVKRLFEQVEYKRMHYANQHTNRVLKEIGATAKIKKPLTAHLARHTFGVRAAHVMSLEACAKLMGITVKVCSVYYKIIDKVSDEEYKKLFPDK